MFIASKVFLGPVIPGVTQESIHKELTDTKCVTQYDKFFYRFLQEQIKNTSFEGHFEVRNQKVYPNSRPYRKGTDANKWHFDRGFFGDMIAGLTIGEAPTEYLIGEIDSRAYDPVPQSTRRVKAKNKLEYVNECITSGKAVVKTFPNQIVLFDELTFHRAPIVKNPGSRIFFRAKVDRRLVENYFNIVQPASTIPDNYYRYDDVGDNS
jgi:hypothetical protein